MRGFTLIEVLVAVSVVGVLAAILMTSLNKGRESSMRSKSIANVRSATMAVLLYAADNNNNLPDKNSDSDPWPQYRAMGTTFISSKLIDPYLPWKSDSWYDPFVAYETKQANEVKDSAGYLWRGRLHYNQGLTGAQVTYAKNRGLPIALDSIARPSEAYLFANLDGAGRGGYPSGYATVGFADGSVRLVEDITYSRPGTAPNVSPSVLRDFVNTGVSGKPYGLRGFDW